MQPNNPVIHMNRGCARYGVGDYGDAILDLTLGLEKNPGSQVGYGYRALSHEEGADFQLEIDDLNSSLRLKPNDPVTLAHLGYAESRLGSVEAALRDCDRAVALSPKNPDLFRFRAYVRDIAGDYAGAGRDYAESVKETFAAEMARIRWAIDSRRQKLSDMEAELRGRAPAFQDPWTRAIGLYVTGALDDGQLVSRAEASAPDLKSRHLGQAFYYIGISHLLGGDPDGARSFLDKARNVGLPSVGETGLAQAELGRLGLAANDH